MFSALPPRADIAHCSSRHVCFVPAIGIGGSLAAPPLPHHRTYGSVYGGSRSYANALRSNDSTRVGWAFGFMSNRSDERIDLLGRQMPRQSRTISLGHARNGQRKIRRCLADLEEIPEEVPQMRRQGLITERWRPRRQVLQKADDIGRCDP